MIVGWILQETPSEAHLPSVNLAAAGADAGFRVRGGASGVSRIQKVGGGGASGPIYEKGGGGGGGGALQVPYTKSGGGASGPIYEKWGGGGGGGAFQVPYTKSGGGGGGALQVRYTKSGGGAFRFRYLWAHRKYLHVPTYVLPRFASHARANESKIHAGKGFLSSIC